MRYHHQGSETGDLLRINPQIEQEINLCVQALRRKEFIIFPCETGWCLGCDLSDSSLVEKIVSIPGAEFSSILLYDTGRLHKFVKEIPETLYDLSEYSNRPIDFYLENVNNVPDCIRNIKGGVPFRISKDEFSHQLLYKFGKAVFTALLPPQMAKDKATQMILNTPVYMVNLRISAQANPQSLVIIRMSPNGKIEFIRK
jgi:L-threonylcarbamoyladenylate synthase